MCGFFGYISSEPLELNRLKQITQTLSHRGPDLSGHVQFEEGRVGFGHQRLSIIDLSDSAKQPMTSSDGRYCLVYNGEIYNYQLIKSQILEKREICFRSSSDTEVLLEAFVLWGPEFVKMLNGIFAFAIYDKIERKTWVFRDRMGVKPLYLYQDQETIAFSSEIKGLREIPHIQLTVNRKSIYEYLHLGYIPGSRSAWEQINKLPHGCYLTIDANRNSETVRYWNIAENVSLEKHTDFLRTKTELSELLHSAVKMQLVSDVPVGVFLSGGIDSSLVAAMACQYNRDQVNTFSIGFEEVKFDESKHAQKVAEYLGTNHTEFRVSQKDALELVDELIDVYDEPFSDASAIPTFLVSRLAKPHVTVVLTGDGGDEQFQGYGAYQWAERMNNPVLYRSRKLIAWMLKRTGNERNARAAEVFDFQGGSSIRSHIFSQEQNLFSQQEINNLLKIIGQFEQEAYTNKRTLTARERQALFDLQYYLPDDLLVKVDRASMANSVECRVPLLDHRVLEYSINIDEALKNQDGITKYLLKEILFELVPGSLFDRPKWGFSVPLNKWLKGELSFLVDELLDDNILYSQYFIDRSYVNKLITDFRNGRAHYCNRIWALIILNKWLNTNA